MVKMTHGKTNVKMNSWFTPETRKTVSLYDRVNGNLSVNV